MHQQVMLWFAVLSWARRGYSASSVTFIGFDHLGLVRIRFASAIFILLTRSKRTGRDHLMLIVENLQCIFKINLFILIGGQSPYNILVVFAIHWHESAMGVHVFPILIPPHLPPNPIPQGHPSAPALSTLSHAANLDWWSISHMVIYVFQCYSLKSSHSHLLPQSPKSLFFTSSLYYCLACRDIVTIFLNSIYMH